MQDVSILRHIEMCGGEEWTMIMTHKSQDVLRPLLIVVEIFDDWWRLLKKSIAVIELCMICDQHRDET